MSDLEEGRLVAPLTSTKPADVVMSPDGTRLYVAGVDGNVRVYDLADRSLLATWDVGTQLGGIAVSPDGTFLMAAETSVVGFRTDGTWFYTTSVVYQVDTSTGAVETHSVETQGGDHTFYDVAILADNSVLLTQGAYSAHLPLWTLNPTTGQFTSTTETYNNRSTLETTTDRSHALVADGSTSAATTHIYEAGVGVVYTHGDVFSQPRPVQGYNAGTMTISEAAGLVIQNTMSGTYVLNLALQFQYEMTTVDPNYYFGPGIVGLVFDASGTQLFMLSDDTDEILQFSFTPGEFKVVRTFDVGADVGDRQLGHFANRLELSPDGRTFTVVTATGIQLVENDAYDNVFSGTVNNDVIDGGAGNDTLFPGAGQDTVDGGTGDDTIVLTDVVLPLEVFDGGAGFDTLELRQFTGTGSYYTDAVGTAASYVLALGTVANIEQLRFGSTAETGVLAAFSFNQIASLGTLTLQGGAGRDILSVSVGSPGTYTVPSLILTDWSSASPPNTQAGDFVGLSAGGAGPFTLNAREGLASTQFLGGGFGNDLLNGSSGVDVLFGNAGNDTLSGGSGDDVLAGHEGDDYLDGGAGVDHSEGGGGNDVFVVDQASDTVVELAGGGDDRVYALVSYALGADAHVEVLAAGGADPNAAIDLTGNDLANNLWANQGANTLLGGGGEDSLFGFAGSDYLDGGSGADFLVGGTGDDIYVVDDALDHVIEHAGEGQDKVYAISDYTLGAGSSVEILIAGGPVIAGGRNLTGNELANNVWDDAGDNDLYGAGGDDALFGFAGADYLDGGSGVDFLVGGTGDDVLVVDDAGDVVVEVAGEGSDMVYASSDYALAAGQSIEILAAGGADPNAAIDLAGNELANNLWGNAGGNLLNGADGDDALFGFGGNDDLFGGDGSNLLVGGAGDDNLFGGNGADILLGEAGADSFLFYTPANASVIDVIGDFSAADDLLVLGQGVFPGLAPGMLAAGAFVNGTAAQDADDRLIYDQATGALWFDADGNGAGAQVQFATLNGSPTIGAGDFLVI